MIERYRLRPAAACLAVLVLIGFVAAAVLLHGTTRSLGKDQGAAVDLDKGLVGYWKFDETGDRVLDSSGKDNNGIYVNASVSAGWRVQALEVSGDNDSHASIPASPSLDEFTDKITVSAWVLPRVPPPDYRVVVSRQIGVLPHPDQFYLGFGPVKGSMHYKWHLGTIEDGKVNDLSIYTGDIASGRWIHMAGVYNGKKMHLYVDGKRIGSRAATGTIQVDDNPVTIGAEENGTEALVVEGEFDGKIDEVRIYNRALTASEIKALSKETPS